MNELQTAKQNLADALRELHDAEMLIENTPAQFDNKMERLNICASIAANRAQVVRLELRANECGVIK